MMRGLKMMIFLFRQVSGKGVGTLSNGALSMVNSYIAAKASE